MSEEKVELDIKITEELQKEGNVRDFVRAVQELRKNKNLMPADKVELLVETDEKGKEFLTSVIEKIKKFIIIDDAFTIENEMLTPTMKTRRHQVKKVFGDQLEKLYF